MAGPPWPMPPEELEMCTAADSLVAAPRSKLNLAQAAAVAHVAAVARAAAMALEAHATVVAHVAAVAHAAAKVLEAASAVADNCEPNGTRRSIRELNCLRTVLFFPARTPIRGT